MSRYNITQNKKAIKVTASYLRKLIKESIDEQDVMLVKQKFKKLHDEIEKINSDYDDDARIKRIKKQCKSITEQDYDLINNIDQNENFYSFDFDFELVTKFLLLYSDIKDYICEVSYFDFCDPFDMLDLIRSLENEDNIKGLPIPDDFSDYSSDEMPKLRLPPNYGTGKDTQHLYDPITGEYIGESRKIKISSSQLKNLIRKTINETKQKKRNQIRIR